MRIDKYLKVSRIIKRRTVACEACENKRVLINGKVAKPSQEVKINDIITILFGDNVAKFKVININENNKKTDILLYEVVNE